MGDSLTFTDLETNMSQLPATAKWMDTYYLTTIRTARTTRKDAPNNQYWENDIWRTSTIPPLHWRQIRVIKVMATTRLLPVELQNQLSQLYVKRLSYIPAVTIGPAGSPCRTQDDTSYASSQVSSVVIYSSDFIRTMKFTYVDKSSSTKHEGTEKDGSEHMFVLTNAEYITEMLIWGGDWVYGLQFVTNLGRCSPHYGGSGHTPSMARSKGGVLVGVISLIKQHEYGRLFHKIQGIWRHDVVNKVPKEDDVFSDYVGSKTHGRSFNDRIVVRNSGMAISKIEMQCGTVIDSIQFTYTDKTSQGQNEFQTERHGGLGGHRKDFVLKPGEHIVSVSGKYDNEHITQMSFVTNKGRPSEVFGQGNSNGSSRTFLSSPEDKEGNPMRLQYICGKSSAYLNGIMFIWTPL
ncbi:jacalin-like lectin domain protein [Rhizoctonia solani 123E]|uniref:Jacalin-like lectin domain protein n=1 Tax=Rhizoctonia solani 123E TaxID=1423351 RepID=A0A074S7N0_9AGAM|nr:jacalin-like lectin domain protein [Rhizoctonia solani 123E]